jgi:hypothetical protein
MVRLRESGVFEQGGVVVGSIRCSVGVLEVRVKEVRVEMGPRSGIDKRIWAESTGARRRSVKKRFKSCSGFAAGAASESLFSALRGRSTRELSRLTASRSPRESLSRSPSSNPFPAKTSSQRPFSSSRCYQCSCLTILFA